MAAQTKTWITDAKGNRCSVEYWGSVEDAQKALDSLENCSGCSDCSGCSRCSGCSGCSRCSGCSGCSGCSDCSRCSGCSGCSDCSDCSGKTNNSEPTTRPDTPIIPDIHASVYAAASAPNALRMSTWHTCGTTHCRAGWVVTLAGEAGLALERFYNTELAAMMIYDASDPEFKINPARFYDSEEDALADMRTLAGSLV